MFQLINSQILNRIKPKEVKTSGFIFKLITRYTVIFLIISSLVISCKQYFGDPIQCITESKYKAQIDIYCWTHGTYINERLLHEKKEIGKHMVNYGIGGDLEGDKYIYQHYYQWVVPILLLEALIFYFPKVLWRSWENGRMQAICSKINCPYINDEWNSEHKIRILQYMRSVTKKCHRIYALKYFFCETLACSAVAKCKMYIFGPSQTVVKLDALCILPHNVVNEKIFVFLYMWMLILLGLSLSKLLHNLCLLLNLTYRTKTFQQMTATSLSNKNIVIATNKCDIGHWFLFNLLTKNIDEVLINDLVADMLSFNCNSDKASVGSEIS
ncbi:unnamed protein product [Diamesa tonsa]